MYCNYIWPESAVDAHLLRQLTLIYAAMNGQGGGG